MADMTREEIEALLARVPEGHTPGPWYPVFNGHFWDISLDVAPMSHSVADTCASNSMYGEHMGPDGQPGNHGEANAALIALAPDLVAALRASLARIAELEAALADAEEVLSLVEHPAQPDPWYHAEVKALGQRIGFGALMTTASAGWRDVAEANGDPTSGVFVAGPCIGTVQGTLRRARAALAPTTDGAANADI